MSINKNRTNQKKKAIHSIHSIYTCYMKGMKLKQKGQGESIGKVESQPSM